MMRHPINPLVDCVFKAILGDPANSELLRSFLNAVLAPGLAVEAVEITNPCSLQDFIGDDQRVVDVLARDREGRWFQLEVQLSVRPWMTTRVVYSSADLYQRQIQRGEDFRQLRPAIAIWVLAQDLLPRSPAWHHTFQLWDPGAGVRLSDHLVIHTLELQKWRPESQPLAPLDQWAYFFREAKSWTELPETLRSTELEGAMRVLERFSEKAEDYHAYQSRMNFLREQASIASWRAELEAEFDATRAELEAQREELGAQREELGAQREELGAQREELGAQREGLEAQREELAARQVALEAQRAELEAQRAELEAMRSGLRGG